MVFSVWCIEKQSSGWFRSVVWLCGAFDELFYVELCYKLGSSCCCSPHNRRRPACHSFHIPRYLCTNNYAVNQWTWYTIYLLNRRHLMSVYRCLLVINQFASLFVYSHLSVLLLHLTNPALHLFLHVHLVYLLLRCCHHCHSLLIFWMFSMMTMNLLNLFHKTLSPSIASSLSLLIF